MIVTIQHVRAVRHNGQGLCARGIRAWCAQVGIDYAKALREGGIPASELARVDDHFSRMVLKQAERMTRGQE